MLYRFAFGLLLWIIKLSEAVDSFQAVNIGAQPGLGPSASPERKVCGAADQYVTVIVFGDSQDTVCSVSYTNKKDAPTDGICNKSAFPPGCHTYKGGLVLSIGRWAQKTNNPMVQQVLNNIGLENVTSVGGLFLDVADGSVVHGLRFLQNLQTITDSGLQVLGSPTLDGLPGLQQVSSIDGNVFIVQTGMTNLTSLSKLLVVGKGMVVIANHNLSSIVGMEKLITVGGPLMLADNSQLQNLTGLDKLVAVGIDPTASVFSGLSITRNKQLVNLKGLSSLVSVGGPVTITDNPRLTSLDGLESLSNVNTLNQGHVQGLHVAYNWRLQDIKALSVLARCSGSTSTRSDNQHGIIVEVYPQRHLDNVTNVNHAHEPPSHTSSDAPPAGQSSAPSPANAWLGALQPLGQAPQGPDAVGVAPAPAKARTPRRRRPRSGQEAEAVPIAAGSESGGGQVDQSSGLAVQTGAPVSHSVDDQSPKEPPAQPTPLQFVPNGAASLPFEPVLPGFSIPSISAAVASVQNALPGLPIRLPFLLSALQKKEHVTIEDIAAQLAPLPASGIAEEDAINSDQVGMEERASSGNLWVDLNHEGIPPGFLDIIGDPYTSPQVLTVVKDHEDSPADSAILPDTNRDTILESYLTRPSDQEALESPAEDQLEDRTGGPNLQRQQILSGALESLTGPSVLTYKATVDLFVEIQHPGKDSSRKRSGVPPLANRADGGSVTDLLVYRCILRTWSDICKYIDSPESVDSGTNWVTSGVCTQVYPHIPGSPSLIGMRL
eukprot:jgi/Botrbrau1/630/Bobra.0161s0021.1